MPHLWKRIVLFLRSMAWYLERGQWRLNQVAPRRHLYPFVFLTMLTGCVTSSVIRQPGGVNAGVPPKVVNPVRVELEWSQVQYRSDSPSVSIDGGSVTSAFGNNIQCCFQASASFTLAPGSHSLSVSVPRNATLGTYIEQLPFDVVDPAFTVTLNPASISLNPGTSKTVTATIARTDQFAGDIAMTIAGLPPGVSATVASPISASGSITLTAAGTAAGGTTSTTVTGTAPCAPGCGGPPVSTASAVLAVTVVAPGFTVASGTPSSALIPRGGTLPIAISVTRTGGFNGPINITTTNLPAGVSAPLTTIVAGGNSATLTLTATNSAALAEVAAGTSPVARQVTLNFAGVCMPACPAMTATRSVSVRVGRRAGPFAIATPAIKNAPGAATSADGTIGITYAVTNPPPPGATQFTATYNRVGTAGTLFAANLVQSPIDWGVGFCAASPTIAGVILSGQYGGVTNAPMFYVLPIWAPSTAMAGATNRSFTVPDYAINSYSNTTIAPQLWYSPDCTLAAYVASSFTQTPPLAVTVLDMTTGQSIGSAQQASNAPTQLEVANTAAGQEVQIRFSPTDVRKMAIP
jgi:hypothetical protein